VVDWNSFFVSFCRSLYCTSNFTVFFSVVIIHSNWKVGTTVSNMKAKRGYSQAISTKRASSYVSVVLFDVKVNTSMIFANQEAEMLFTTMFKLKLLSAIPDLAAIDRISISYIGAVDLSASAYNDSDSDSQPSPVTQSNRRRFKLKLMPTPALVRTKRRFVSEVSDSTVVSV